MTTMTQPRPHTRYEGPLPVERQWIVNRPGIDRIGILYRMSLDNLIDVDGIDGMNDYLDAVTGVILTDIDYHIDRSAEPGNDSVLILATGTIDMDDLAGDEADARLIRKTNDDTPEVW